jgi:hypothetical protein
VNPEVPVTKNAELQQPVPSIWREPLRAIVESLIAGDYVLSTTPICVLRLSAVKAQTLRNSITTYGATLISLPEKSWESSACQWMISYWDVLVDLYTLQEGQSDLSMAVRVREADGGFTFELQSVHVP